MNDCQPAVAVPIDPGLNGAKIRAVWEDWPLIQLSVSTLTITRSAGVYMIARRAITPIISKVLPVATPTQAGSLCYINFPECETMSQKHLMGGPRTNGNHADRLM
jgi:hypothetical protein